MYSIHPIRCRNIKKIVLLNFLNHFNSQTVKLNVSSFKKEVMNCWKRIVFCLPFEMFLNMSVILTGRIVHRNRSHVLLHLSPCESARYLQLCLISCHLVHFAVFMLFVIQSHDTFLLQSIPIEMDFDPNSNPPCYKTVDEVLFHC